MTNYIKNNNKFYGSIKNEKGLKKLGWNSKGAQCLRFKELSKIGNMNNKTILDVGCGIGDFAKFCKESNITLKGYMGVDIYPHNFRFIPKAIFIELDILSPGVFILPQFDYVISSGAFSLKSNKSITKKMVKRCFELCKKGFAFNLPCDMAPKGLRNHIIEYYNAYKMFKFCRTLCNNVTLIRGYLPHDFTIHMVKE